MNAEQDLASTRNMLFDKLIDTTVKKVVSEYKTKLEITQLVRARDYFKDCETSKIRR